MKKNIIKKKRFTLKFYKEVAMAILAIISVLFVFFEYFIQLNSATLHSIQIFELIVVGIFLSDFFICLYIAPDRKKYFRSNWYLLIASIPILDSWAELLRALRILELVRLLRAGEHLSYVYHAIKE